MEKVLLVRYEDLVKDNKTIENILSFLSADSGKKEVDEIQPLNLEAFIVEEKFRERFLKKYSDLNKKLNSNRINSWKEQLSLKEIEVCDTVCGKTASYIGYMALTKASLYSKIRILACNAMPMSLGYFDILKDRILFYLPVQFKLNRLRKKYIELGFIKK
jgi:hypothetical protein